MAEARWRVLSARGVDPGGGRPGDVDRGVGSGSPLFVPVWIENEEDGASARLSGVVVELGRGVAVLAFGAIGSGFTSCASTRLGAACRSVRPADACASPPWSCHATDVV